MTIKIIKYRFTVCKIEDISQVDFNDEFCFLGKTDEELSLVCRSDKVPQNTIDRQDGWRAFRIEGVLDFSLIGILSRISSIIAEKGIGIFAVSTYNTDYVLVSEEDFDKAVEALSENGFNVIRQILI